MGKLISDTDRCAEQMPFIRPKAGTGLILKDCFSGTVFHSSKWKQHVEEIVMLSFPYTPLYFPTSYPESENII